MNSGFFPPSPIALWFWWSRCKRKGNTTSFWAFYSYVVKLLQWSLFILPRLPSSGIFCSSSP